MKIDDHLYFAPGIKFSEVDTTDTTLAQQIGDRIRGFYLEPARVLIESGHAFASGVLLVVAIDALARLETGNQNVGDRFKEWCNDHLHNCTASISRQFYEKFRNGLVHEARIKDGGEFNLENDSTFEEKGLILSCNPTHLLAKVDSALAAFVQTLEAEPAELEAVRNRILEDFSYEFDN